ncbi:hypothetical protein FRC07_003749 [Ceratobasidium sp. 392]|nr:hypothetical protein FRC07_003749 [Ceratobasidium sp. 392]
MSTLNHSISSVPKPFRGTWDGESKIVIGIDIGTTQSGVAFAFLQKGVEQTIHRVTQWPGQEAHNQQSKIPTLVWYDLGGKAVSFGAEALSHKAKEDADDNNWQLARHFKLHLHPDDMKTKHDLKLDPRIVDGTLMWENYRSNMEVVIAHPNGWGIREQAFLRAAAIDARFASASSPLKIRFVTEAEASVGTQFAVCDAGGSTVDTTTYAVVAARPALKLEEARVSACVQAGAIFVDAAAEKYVRNALNNVSLNSEEIQEYTARGVKDFESVAKRNFRNPAEDSMIEIAGPRFNNPSIRTRRGRMTLPGTTIKSFFEGCLEEIVASVDRQIEETSVSHMILVGGFGDSPFMRQEFRTRYEPRGCQVTLTNDSTSKAVADGAVIWNVSNSVVGRKPRTSVGIEGITLDVQAVSRATFSKYYWVPVPDLDEFQETLYTYSKEGDSRWLKDKEGQPAVHVFLFRHALRTIKGDLLSGFQECCTIAADLGRLSGALDPRIGVQGNTYWELIFDVCIRFGGTEWEAYLEWKEDLIETTCSKPGRKIDSASIKSTDNVESRDVCISNKTLTLIDTPGFDHLGMSDFEAWARLADYLLDEARVRIGISSILYVHRARDPVESKTLAQNIGVLSNIFLGDSGLPRLNVVVVPEPGIPELPSTNSLSSASIFSTVQSKGATIINTMLDQKSIDDILISCATKDPILLRIQQEYLNNPRVVIGNQIEEKLGYYEAESIELRVEEQVTLCLVSRAERIRLLETALKEKESLVSEHSHNHAQTKRELSNNLEEVVSLRNLLCQVQAKSLSLQSQLQVQENSIDEMLSLELTLKDHEVALSELSQAHEVIMHQLADSRSETLILRQHLDQTQKEYAALRSQLQFQENIEQKDVVQTLKDLNRDVDDVGRLISEFLVDNHVQRLFSKTPDSVTSLDARHLPQLKTLLGHVEGRSSLLASSEEVGTPAEDFLDYAIRMLLCKHLYERVFRPFHPAAEPAQNEIIALMYNDVQWQESQAVASRWRANCFKSIYTPENPEAPTRHIHLIAQDFVDGGLSPLLKYFFGEATGLVLESQHLNRLTQLFQAAWDWNSVLKGDVIALGDFYQTYYDPLRYFDPSLMDEFEPVPRRPPPKCILGTLGLGLLSSRAVGGGKKPEVTVVYKATVATKSLSGDLGTEGDFTDNI